MTTLNSILKGYFPPRRIRHLILDYRRFEWGKIMFDSSKYSSPNLMDSLVTIGRDCKCTVQVDHIIVSHLHCIIRFSTQKIILEDQSTNGTWVNNQLVHHAKIVLHHGDSIVLARPSSLHPEEVRCTFYLFSTMCQVGMYSIERVLGIGSFAQVNVCTNTQTGTKYAIKFSDQNVEKDRQIAHKRHPLMQEVRALRLIQHPNIVQFIDAFETKHKDIYCVILELFSGMNLFDKIIEHGKFSECDSKKIFMQLHSAITYLHEHNIVHRDLKPDNIMFVNNSKESEVKIIDFGLSEIASPSTLMETFCGTLEYTAPEIINNQSYDARVDIWSLGVILYMLLCGTQPFQSYTIESIIHQIKHGEYEVSDDWLRLSTHARHLVGNLLQVDPSKRITLKEIQSHPWVVSL
jgi:calcium/calmodulin-dependent protein kinase I